MDGDGSRTEEATQQQDFSASILPLCIYPCSGCSWKETAKEWTERIDIGGSKRSGRASGEGKGRAAPPETFEEEGTTQRRRERGRQKETLRMRLTLLLSTSAFQGQQNEEETNGE
jgi:hypothetical protein